MSLPSWPAGLPQFFLLGFSESQAPNYIEGGVDVGIPRTRKRYTAPLRNFSSVSFRVTPAQRVILDNFYATYGGSEWEYTDPADLETTIVCKFTAGPQYTYSVPMMATIAFRVVPS